ncbi:hypothetical protein JTE90_023469 [Oedothorax gibbosus]|uniref:BTB domain-containing protein n=1 Tax=Oedothorax gibbosus TaxID=931172 RepID=A0AAV6TK82_9ARAC|nr:hypothetical protein JTE90_023469 [Oedothorax gibbosus]
MAKVLRWIRNQWQVNAKICSCLKSGEADHEDRDDSDFWDDTVAQQENVVPEADTEEQPVDEEEIAMKADRESENKTFDEDTDTDVVLEEGKEQESVEVVAQTEENTSVSVDEPTIPDPQEPVFLEEVNDSEPNNESCSSSSGSETTSNDGELNAPDIFEDDTSLHSNKFQLVKKVDLDTEESVQTIPSDLLIVLNKDQEFYVHQEMLTENSQFFRERLNTKRKTYYTMHLQSDEVNPDALSSILDVLYAETLPPHNLMPQVLQTAEFFKMDGFLNKVEEVKPITTDMEIVSSSSTSNESSFESSSESSSETSDATDSEEDAMIPQMPKKTHVSIFLEEFWDD